MCLGRGWVLCAAPARRGAPFCPRRSAPPLCAAARWCGRKGRGGRGCGGAGSGGGGAAMKRDVRILLLGEGKADGGGDGVWAPGAAWDPPGAARRREGLTCGGGRRGAAWPARDRET